MVLKFEELFSNKHRMSPDFDDLPNQDILMTAPIHNVVELGESSKLDADDCLLYEETTRSLGTVYEPEGDLLFDSEVKSLFLSDNSVDDMDEKGYSENYSIPLSGEQQLSDATFDYLQKRGRMQLVLVEVAKIIVDHLLIRRAGDQMYFYRQKIWEKLLSPSLLREVTADFLPCHDVLRTNQFSELFKILQGKIESYEELWLDDPVIQTRICFRNAVYDLESDTLQEHSPEYPFVSYIPFDYIPGESGAGQVFDAYLESVSLGNEAVKERVLQLIGYVCSNLPNIKTIALLLGERDSGKTTLARVIAEIVGWKNVQSFSFDSINRFTNDEMFGKKLALCTDLKGARISESAIEWIKTQTGGDVVHADVKYGKGYSYISTCRYVLASNFRPDLGEDDALENRFLVIPFPKSVPDSQKNPNLVHDIQAEMQHVFYLVMAALRRFLDDGMQFADIGEWEYYTPNYYTNLSTNVAQFFRDRCSLDENGKVSRKDMYDYYCQYCKDQDEKILSPAKFFREFKKIAKENGIRDDTNDGRKYKGIMLKKLE